MIERHDRELVVLVEQIEQEPLDGRSRVDQALSEHAVAHIEQHRKADGHALVGELRDGLALAFFENFERLDRQARHEVPVAIDDRGGHADEIDARLESGRAVLGEKADARSCEEENRAVSSAHAPNPTLNPSFYRWLVRKQEGQRVRALPLLVM